MLVIHFIYLKNGHRKKRIWLDLFVNSPLINYLFLFI
jgi:Cft2 family RNA processing exonuclease